MKLGYLSAILGEYSFEEMIDFAKDHGYECVEVACWPKGTDARRYAGVTHIDVDTLDEEGIAKILGCCAEKGVQISSLAYYPNPLDPDTEKRDFYIQHIKKLILAAAKMGIGMVTTFAGRIQNKTVEENLVVFKEVWEPIIRIAEENKVKVAFENCPMLFTNDEWPGGQNIATTPAVWERIFNLIPSNYLGINYDPSHFVWQQIDYIKPIYRFRNKIFHVHIKDVKLFRDKLNDVGIMAPPLQYMSPKLPGYGDINWGSFISALTDIGYNGFVCIEVEDKVFEKTPEDIKKSLILSKKYVEQFVI